MGVGGGDGDRGRRGHARAAVFGRLDEARATGAGVAGNDHARGRSHIEAGLPSNGLRAAREARLCQRAPASAPHLQRGHHVAIGAVCEPGCVALPGFLQHLPQRVDLPMVTGTSITLLSPPSIHTLALLPAASSAYQLGAVVLLGVVRGGHHDADGACPPHTAARERV